MYLLAQILFDLLLGSSDRSVISEGSSSGMQIAAVAMIGIGGILLFCALVALYLP